MTSIAIALGLLSIWAAGLALAGAYWLRKERRIEKRKKLRGQQNFAFPESNYSSPFAEHSLKR